jgi:hypothetical protein
MHFQVKNILKSNSYHTPKHPLNSLYEKLQGQHKDQEKNRKERKIKEKW